MSSLNKKILYIQTFNYNPHNINNKLSILWLYKKVLNTIHILTIYISLLSYIYIYED